MSQLWSIRNSASIPGASGEPQWVVFIDERPAGPADELPVAEAELLKLLSPPTEADAPDVAAVDRAHPSFQGTVCPFALRECGDYQPLPARGRLELAMGVARGHIPQLIGRWAGHRLAPTLAKALDRLHADTSPVVAPVKSMTGAELAEQQRADKAAAAKRAAAERKAELLSLVAKSLRGGTPEKAAAFVDAVKELLAA